MCLGGSSASAERDSEIPGPIISTEPEDFASSVLRSIATTGENASTKMGRKCACK